MDNELGKRIAQYRKARGLTQEAMAQALGVSPQAVSKWEVGASCPDILLLPQLSNLLGVSVDTLLSGEAVPAVQVQPQATRKKPEDMVLHLIATEPGGNRMTMNLPIVLVKVALEIGLSLPQFSGKRMENIDLEKILQMVELGLTGKLMEADSAEGEHFEVVVD